MINITEKETIATGTVTTDDAGVTASIVIERAELMDRYFTIRDQSAIAAVPFFRIATVEWGYGFIEQVGGKDSVAMIPTTSTGLDTVLYENVPDLAYVNNVISLRCVMPAGVVPEGQVEEVSAVNIKDAQGNCLAISVVLPIPVTSDRLLQFDIEIRIVDGDA